jgi:hypothetical protein
MNRAKNLRVVAIGVVLVVCILQWAGGTASAAAAVGQSIEVDGKLLLDHVGAGKPHAEPAFYWWLLGRGMGVTEDAEIKADEGNPRKATLTGEIVIRVRVRGDYEFAMATVNTLNIERKAVGSRYFWYLSEEEIRRTGAIAGIELSDPPGDGKSKGGDESQSVLKWSLMIGGAILLVAIVVAGTHWRGASK